MAIEEEIAAGQEFARKILHRDPARTKTGTAKFWDDEKGWGVITPDNGDPDIYVHFKSIIGRGRKTLTAGEKVSFEITKGPRSLMAVNVTPV